MKPQYAVAMMKPHYTTIWATQTDEHYKSTGNENWRVPKSRRTPKSRRVWRRRYYYEISRVILQQLQNISDNSNEKRGADAADNDSYVPVAQPARALTYGPRRPRSNVKKGDAGN